MFGSWRSFFKKQVIVSENDIKKISKRVIGSNNPLIKFYIEDSSNRLENEDIYVFYKKMNKVVEKVHAKNEIWLIFEKWKKEKAKENKEFKDFMKEIVDNLLEQWLLSL